MIDPARRKRILGLALPIIGGMVSQNVLNLVDTAMVGTLGDAALAAVGLGGFANFMCIAFITGMSTGVQAMAARRLGEGRTRETAVPLNGGLLLVAALAIPATILLIWAAPTLFSYLDDDVKVVSLGSEYLQIRLGAMIAVGMNFAFRGYWNAVDKSKLYLRTLLVMHVTNIFLNWVLIFGHFGLPAMGTSGAALGTAISTFVGTGYYFYLGRTHAKSAGFLRGLPRGETLPTMLRLAVPAGLQQFFFAAGMTVFMRLVGVLGTSELAAASVLINLLLVAILPALGFGLAAATLAGQALGRKDPADAKAWGWDVVRLAAFVLSILAVPGVLMPELMLWPFIKNPETLAVAAGPLRVIALSLPLEAVTMVLMNALLGAGATRLVMAFSISTQWALQLPLVWFLGPHLGYGLTVVWVGYTLGRLVFTGAVVFAWQRGGWAEVKV